MKNITLIIIFLFSSQFILAQDVSKPLPISIGYFGNFLFQPGIKVGTQFELKNWETNHKGKKRLHQIEKLFYFATNRFLQLASKNINFLINADVGYQRVKLSRNTFFSVSLGIGYLLESRVTSVVYNLSDGSISKKNRKLSNHFIPTLNYEFGKVINSKLTWYSKFSLGRKLSFQRENSTLLFVEAGVKFNLKNK